MKFQAPKGTRDFYPEAMAWRRYLESKWRDVSIRNGFEEVDGPIFERLGLYEVKSGPGIVSEVFQVTREGGETTFAIRPEFTPTLARMVAAKANSLPKPIKWFCMPNLCRGERPQRGRLREFLQWNIDMLGLEDPVADAEVIYTCVDLLRELGLASHQVQVKISHREVVRRILTSMGVPDDRMNDAFELLDRRDKMDAEAFQKAAGEIGLEPSTIERFNQMGRVRQPLTAAWDEVRESFGVPAEELQDLHLTLQAFGIAEWCEYDLGIVRGLAYYTGTVFEVHEVNGAERAMAGGGRYDRLIELMGGPDMPAVGFGMGDVVLSLVLADKGLMPTDVMPAVDAFIFAADAEAREQVARLVAVCRDAGLHARMTYRSTTNVGKLLKEAGGCGAKYAVIVNADTPSNQQVQVKHMADGEQTGVAITDLPNYLRRQGG